MILVTFHGGPPGAPTSAGINQIYGYDETTSPPTEYQNVLSMTDSSLSLSELRGMLLTGGVLYVVNGGKDVSNILGFTQVQNGTSPSFENPALFAPSSQTIDHPFGVTTGVTTVQQMWWVSNQDSNVVALLTAPMPTSTPPFSPADPLTSGPAGTFLQTLLTNLQVQKKGTFAFLDGSFIASCSDASPLPQVTPVAASWGGVDAKVGVEDSDSSKKSKPKVENSVRGVLLAGGILYVADEVGGCVRMYDPTSGILWGSAAARSPVHLVVQNNILYVSTSDGVFSGACPSPPTTDIPALPEPFKKHDLPVPPYPKNPPGYNTSVSLTLSSLGLSPAPGSPSGICFDGDGNLYVASRTGKQIFKYVPNASGSPPFLPSNNGEPLITTPDQPEFLLWYAWQSS
jgi:hypothetical protein